MTQMPTIVLGQDEVDCFAAWVSIEAGLPEWDKPTGEIKVTRLNQLNSNRFGNIHKIPLQINYGKLLLEALLEYWTPPHLPKNEHEQDLGNGYFQVPEHTPLIFR